MLARSLQFPRDAQGVTASRERRRDHWIATRENSFFAWTSGQRQELLGQGSYGKVFRLAGNSAVVKDCTIAKGRHEAIRSALQEQTIAVVLTHIVLDRVCPHYLLLFNSTLDVETTNVHTHMTIEAFDGSIDKVKNWQACWTEILFQIFHALSHIHRVLALVHNDLYPRNILIRQLNIRCRYDFPSDIQTSVWLDAPFLVALADFGISTSERLFPNAPLRLRKKATQPTPQPFGQCVFTHHVLEYTSLPAFARDYWALLQWTLFPSRHVAPPPGDVLTILRAVRDELNHRWTGLQAPEGSWDIFKFFLRQPQVQARLCRPSATPCDCQAWSPEDVDGYRQNLLDRAAVFVRSLPITHKEEETEPSFASLFSKRP